MGEEIDIQTLSTEETFQMFVANLDPELEETEKRYAQVRFGISLSFDMYDYINDVIVVKGKIGKVIHRGHVWKSEDFWTELEQRTRLAKQYLMNLEEDSPWGKPKLGKKGGENGAG